MLMLLNCLNKHRVRGRIPYITASGGNNIVITIFFFSQMGKPTFEVEGSVFFVCMLKIYLEEKKSTETVRTIKKCLHRSVNNGPH